jgi:DNA primase
MAGFSPQLLDEVRARVDLVELVGQFVNLKRAGENWKGLCPFHAERTPSFTVNPKRGIFHCFGCGAGGDAFGFLMRHDRMAFPEAVRALAERAGVALPTGREVHPEAEGKIEALRRIMALAAEFYGQCLREPGGAKAREYLDRRGVDPEVGGRFGLGYAPEGWNSLLGAMARQGIAEEQLVQAGLALPRQTGSGCYDRFRGRLLFPIRDAQGRVVAFGGRALAGEEPKYLNSPETPIYVKGQMLYGLDLARGAMHERGRAIIVEGYLDCLMAHQHGFDETVAALGTAFTAAQLALLRRHASEVIALFDADAAGQKAAARLEEMTADGGEVHAPGWALTRARGSDAPDTFSIQVAMLPSGHDPDSLLRAEGAPALHACIARARPLLAFVLDKVLAEEDLGTARGRATAHARAALLLSRVSNPEEATVLSRETARQLGVDATQLWIEAQQLQGARARDRRTPPRNPAASVKLATTPWPPPTLAERDLLALLLHVEEARVELLASVEDEDVAHPGLRAILSVLRRAPEGPAEGLMAEMAEEAERALLASILVEERRIDDVQGMIHELRKRYDIRRRKQRVRLARQAIAQAQATGDPGQRPLEAELRNLQQEAEAVRDLAVTRVIPSGPNAGR